MLCKCSPYLTATLEAEAAALSEEGTNMFGIWFESRSGKIEKRILWREADTMVFRQFVS